MYHHVNSDDLPLSNTQEMLENHFLYISQNFSTIFPGEECDGKKVCLTFDDAYYDFYHYVYPLLKKYDLKALLAVPVAFILDSTHLSANERLSLKHAQIYENYQLFAPFCTYKELHEMVQSGHVRLASHSMNHVDLTKSGVDLHEEIIASKELLEKKLDLHIDSFVLPYGKYNAEVIAMAQKRYPYVFRIGNALNPSWDGIDGLIYRIKGDGIKAPDELFKPSNQFMFWIKMIIKRIKSNR